MFDDSYLWGSLVGAFLDMYVEEVTGKSVLEFGEVRYEYTCNKHLLMFIGGGVERTLVMNFVQENGENTLWDESSKHSGIDAASVLGERLFQMLHSAHVFQ